MKLDQPALKIAERELWGPCWRSLTHELDLNSGSGSWSSSGLCSKLAGT